MRYISQDGNGQPPGGCIERTSQQMLEQIGRLIQTGLGRLRDALNPGTRQAPAPVPVRVQTPPLDRR
jgi:hypothetical protein